MPEYKRQLRWWGLLFVTVVCLYLCWLMIQPFVGVLAWATVFLALARCGQRQVIKISMRVVWNTTCFGVAMPGPTREDVCSPAPGRSRSSVRMSAHPRGTLPGAL